MRQQELLILSDTWSRVRGQMADLLVKAKARTLKKQVEGLSEKLEAFVKCELLGKPSDGRIKRQKIKAAKAAAKGGDAVTLAIMSYWENVSALIEAEFELRSAS